MFVWGNLISPDSPVHFLWHEKHPVTERLSSICRSQPCNPHLSLSGRLFQYVINNGITLCPLWKKRLCIHWLHKVDRMETVIFITVCFPLPWIIVIWLHSLSRVAFSSFISKSVVDCRWLGAAVENCLKSLSRHLWLVTLITAAWRDLLSNLSFIIPYAILYDPSHLKSPFGPRFHSFPNLCFSSQTAFHHRLLHAVLTMALDDLSVCETLQTNKWP